MNSTSRFSVTVIAAVVMGCSINLHARGGTGGGGGGGGGGGVDNPPPPPGTLETLQKRLAGDATARAFGYTVALSGDIAVAAAPATANGKGAVYVFQRSGTLWKLSTKLVTPTGQSNGGFGTSVAVSGDTIAIGSQPTATVASAINVYQRTLGVWKAQTKISVAGSKCLGRSVAINGNTIIAGDPCALAGAAYAFARSIVGATTTWTRQAKFTSSNIGSHVGESVSVSGDTAVISTSSDAAAMVFKRVGSAWSLQAKLSPIGVVFGYYGPGGTVSIDKDTIAVGVPTDSVSVPNRGLMAAAGAAYMFHRSGVTWIQDARLTRLNDARREHLFGRSVSVSGDRVVVGMDEGYRGTGNATVFQRVNGTWNPNGNPVGLNPGGAGFRFGSSVALDRNSLISGSPGEPAVALGESFAPGAAYVYTLPVIP